MSVVAKEAKLEQFQRVFYPFDKLGWNCFCFLKKTRWGTFPCSNVGYTLAVGLVRS